MNDLFDWFGGNSSWLAFLLDTSLKTAVILASALTVTRVLRGASASMRHHVWTLAFAAILALPVLAATLPSWRVSVPGWTADRVPSTPAAPPIADEVGLAGSGPVIASTAGVRAVPAAPEVVSVPTQSVEGDQAAAWSLTGPSALTLLFGIWAVGCLLLLARLCVGVISAWWTTRTAVPITDVGWTRRVEEVAHELGVRSRVRVLQSAWVGTPMAWGLLRPALLLPPEAAGWSADRRRAVVLHEMAHIRRRDCLVHLLAQAARALHWINPLAWIGTKRLRAERERACDDLVLVAGTRSADYARLLLEVARARGDRRLAWAAVSMARPSELEGRLLAILDPARNRRGLGRPAALVALAIAGLLVIPLAAIQAAPTQARVRANAVSVAPDVPSPAARVVVGLAPRQEPVAVARAARAASVAAVRVAVSMATAADTLETRVLDAMLKALGSDRESTRARAAHTLGQTESPSAVPGLIEALRGDPSPEVRRSAAWGLGMIEDEAAVSALSTALGDGSAEVRGEAAWGLGMIEAEAAVSALSTALGDDSAEVRRQAAWALGMIESPDAVDRLIRTVTSDDAADVRSEAAWALGMIEDPGATDALIDAIEDEDEAVAEQAMWALGRVIGNR